VKVTLFLLSALFSLALVEVGLRVAASITSAPLPITYLADPALRSLPALSGMVALQAPNQYGTFKGQLHRTNSQGIRGPEVADPKPPSVFRTVVIGDSFTMGSGVAEEDTYSRQLQNLLNAQDSSFEHEVINLGVGGYNANSSVIRLSRIGLNYDPDLLVYGWTINDIEGLFYNKTSAPRSRPRTGLLLEALLREQVHAFRDMLYPAADSYIAELDQNYFKNPWSLQDFTSSLDSLASISKNSGLAP
jgi:lysophospholipase L1-like esterase